MAAVMLPAPLTIDSSVAIIITGMNPIRRLLAKSLNDLPKAGKISINPSAIPTINALII